VCCARDTADSSITHWIRFHASVYLLVYCLGLDPAKPLYENSGPEDRLDINDALFVDVMHTNGGQNGILKSLGNIDYFPNGGKKQPNCGKSDKGMLWKTCVS